MTGEGDYFWILVLYPTQVLHSEDSLLGGYYHKDFI